MTNQKLDAMIERLQSKPEEDVDHDIVASLISLIHGYEHLAWKLGLMADMVNKIDNNTKAVAGGISTLVDFLEASRIFRTSDLVAFERARITESPDTPDESPDTPDLRPTNQVSA